MITIGKRRRRPTDAQLEILEGILQAGISGGGVMDGLPEADRRVIRSAMKAWNEWKASMAEETKRRQEP